MHELALMEAVVEAVIEHTVGQRVTLVRLEIGELAGVAVDAMRSCFEVCVQGTAIAGAVLEIMTRPGRARCRACGHEHVMRSYAMPCACGSFDRELVSGDELLLKEVEVL